MPVYLVTYVAALAAILVLDGLWLGVIARGLYQRELGALMLEPIRYGVAALFYVGYAAGVTYFAAMPALASGGLAKAMLAGALLGLVAYGTYDFTNYATLKGYTLTIMLVDLAWGTFVTAASSTLAYLAARQFG